MTGSTMEIMDRGMRCLTERLGVIEAEQFISVVMRERCDYTKWQREYYDAMPPGEFHKKAIAYAAEHPYQGSAERL